MKLLISGKILTLQKFLPRSLPTQPNRGDKDLSIQHWSRPFAGRSFVGNNKNISLKSGNIPSANSALENGIFCG
jgi:hypothetical protein